ncbi:MAG: ferrous iron transport protein B [Fidelibacterota bacterium]
MNKKDTSPWVALVGNPNCGKTAIFNLLTGLNQKVSNYPGVTVERKMGYCRLNQEKTIRILDMPGTYSLTPESYDEQIVSEQVFSWVNGDDPPTLIISVIDATNLSRNLYLTSQLLDLGIPVLAVFNMMDRVSEEMILPSRSELIRRLSVTDVVFFSAVQKPGMDSLLSAIERALDQPVYPPVDAIPYAVPPQVMAVLQPLITFFHLTMDYSMRLSVGQSLRIITRSEVSQFFKEFYGRDREVGSELDRLREATIRNFEQTDFSHRTMEATVRYTWIDQLLNRSTKRERDLLHRKSRSEKMDKVLTHPRWGPLVFILLLAGIFQAIFTWASIPMDIIDAGITHFSRMIYSILPDGIFRSLMVDGIIAGVGSILIFLPQILILVFALTMLEDSGYMSRIAFMLDRFMSRLGLHGKSVLPLISGYACAIPGIMAARTIESRKERLLTVLLVPLMSCSARLPIYALMIGALIPPVTILGFLDLQGFTMILMYFLGTATALILALVFSRFLHLEESSSFIMELPPYRIPLMRSVFRQVWLRGQLFIRDAGKIIMAISVALWFLASFPTESRDQGIEASYAGRIGQTIEPIIRPLGFDWKIGVGLVTSFAAREVLVSTLATLYNVNDSEAGIVHLKDAIRNDRDPRTGKLMYSPLMALALMVFYVYAAQCMATFALVKRETNSWKWPIFMLIYMTSLAYFMALLVYQGGSWLGFA